MNVDFEGIDVRVLGQTLIDVLFEAVIRALIASRSASDMAPLLAPPAHATAPTGAVAARAAGVAAA